MERIKNFFKDESGASAVEYGLLVSLIAVVIIAAVTALGTASIPSLTRRDRLSPANRRNHLTIRKPGGRAPPPAGPNFSRRRTDFLQFHCLG